MLLMLLVSFYFALALGPLPSAQRSIAAAAASAKGLNRAGRGVAAAYFFFLAAHWGVRTAH
jgi:hypothetical protein